jgi:ubiquinol-cytochrome c reductase cytochrome b subunit
LARQPDAGRSVIASDTLSLLFALHVCDSGNPDRLVSLHLLMVLSSGSMNGRCPDDFAARHLPEEYEELAHKDGVPFVPDAIWKDLISLPPASCFGDGPLCRDSWDPSGRPDNRTPPLSKRFLARISSSLLYALLSLLPPQLETPSC